MPIINVQMLTGRTPDQKRKYIQELSRATTETLGVPESAVHIVLTEVELDMWATGPKTMAEIRNAPAPTEP